MKTHQKHSNLVFSSLSEWSIWPFLVEWSLDALEHQNKNEHIFHYEGKQMLLSFMGFEQLVTPGRVIDHKLTKITKFCLEGYMKNYTISDTR